MAVMCSSFNTARDVVIYTIAACFFTSSWAWQGWEVTIDPGLEDRIITADVAITYHDVTALTCAQRCAAMYGCGFFTYKASEKACVLCAHCSGMTLSALSGYQFFVMKAGYTDPSHSKPYICESATVTPHTCWKIPPGLLDHVSVGPAGVWGVNRYHNIFLRLDTYQDIVSFGTSWLYVSGSLLQVDVGTGIVWGVNRIHSMCYRSTVTVSTLNGQNWTKLSLENAFSWVSVSPGGSVWAVNTAGHLLHYRHSSNAQPVGTAWDVMDTDVQRVDAGQAGVWALKTDGRLFYRHGTYGDNGSTGTDWRSVEGTFTSVSSGKNVVVVVDTAGHVWVRSGVSSDTPAGLAWLIYPGYMKQVDVYQTDEALAMWGVDFDDTIYFSLM